METEVYSLIGFDTITEMCKLAATMPEGCFVEFGVYKGGSAKGLSIVANAQGRKLHLFDTFCGMPISSEIDSHKIGDFSDTSLEAVKAIVPDAIFHAGVFPYTMPEKFEPIAFLHLDADQYNSYKSAIRLFTPYMVPGSVMWFDDYGCLESATIAVHEELEPGSIKTSATGKAYVVF